MTRHIARAAFDSDTAPAIIVPAPGQDAAPRGRSFDLHPALHIATFGGFFAYLAVMWAAFGERPLILSFAIFAVFFAAAFIVPALWSRVERRPGPFQSWTGFMRDGFDCMTGHLTAAETMAQVLIMPAMLLLWGVSMAVIRVLV